MSPKFNSSSIKNVLRMYRFYILIIICFRLVASTQKELPPLEVSGSSLINNLKTTGNPESSRTLSFPRVDQAPSILPPSTTPSSNLTAHKLISQSFLSAQTSSSESSVTPFPFKEQTTNSYLLSSTIKTPKNVKQSHQQEKIRSQHKNSNQETPQNIKQSNQQEEKPSQNNNPNQELRPSPQTQGINNTATTKTLNDNPNPLPLTVINANTQIELPHIQHHLFNVQTQINHTLDNAKVFTDLSKALDVQNISGLVSTNEEQDMLNWFENASQSWKQPSDDVNITENDDDDLIRWSSPGGFGMCDEDCAKSNRVCVMGSDFKPHCEVAVDVCQQMRCVNGECVSKEGLYMCECKQGWIGPFCDKPCTLECGENGNCGHVDHNGTVGCICHWNYTGHKCHEKRKIEPHIVVKLHGRELEAWETAISVVMSVLAVALICVLLPYLLWRRQWMPIRKLVFYFQEFEDDDDKEFDAFISYKSTPNDEEFILRHLYPKLEKELHFKLCLHFRDFPPGEPIANNIIRAIEGSRRTILILSPSFISSEWCRMEYQKAQYEMLRLKHKIIPIIVEDISDVPNIDKNLKTIIDTVTYITWPGDDENASSKRLTKFWKLLEMSMPKRRPELNRELSSCGSCSSESPLTTVSNTSNKIDVLTPNSDDFFEKFNFAFKANDFTNISEPNISNTKRHTSISCSRNETCHSNSGIENVYSSSNNCLNSNGSIYPFLGLSSISNFQNLQLETASAIPLTPEQKYRHERNDNSCDSESDNEEPMKGEHRQKSSLGKSGEASMINSQTKVPSIGEHGQIKTLEKYEHTLLGSKHTEPSNFGEPITTLSFDGLIQPKSLCDHVQTISLSSDLCVKTENKSGDDEQEKLNFPSRKLDNFDKQFFNNTFFTSDDHIVEIRETFPAGRGLSVKARPRQLVQQIYI